jgi:hypothetical protein
MIAWDETVANAIATGQVLRRSANPAAAALRHAAALLVTALAITLDGHGQHRPDDILPALCRGNRCGLSSKSNVTPMHPAAPQSQSLMSRQI